MCRTTQIDSAKKSLVRRPSSSLLLTTKSFSSHDSENATPPPMASSFITIVFFIAILCVIEHMCRYIFKDAHYLLENDVSYKILARHVGVDFTCCCVVAYLGIKSAHICKAMWCSPFSLHPSGAQVRMFTYHPEAHQILLLFLAYQIKNLFDTIVWNDGPQYVFHHVAAGMAAFFGMYPGYSHYYAIFFMGISEISTAVLVLLANFDDKLGIDGFSEAFPAVKIGLGIFFVITFIVCRVVIWPIGAYMFLKDAQTVLKLNNPQVNTRRIHLKTTVFCLSGLSILQVVFLVQIYVISKAEIEKMFPLGETSTVGV